MNLETRVMLKNNHLKLQGEKLRTNFCALANTAHFKPFFITFVLAPFVVGFVARSALKPISLWSLPVYRTVLSQWGIALGKGN